MGNAWDAVSEQDLAEERYRLWKGLVEADPCEHVPVQTGMAKSWCKHCDVNMRMTDGAYKAEK